MCALCLGLRANVSSSNQTYMNAITTGMSVDSLYSSLQSSRDSLDQAAEVGKSPHSIVSDAQSSSDYIDEAIYRSDPVNNGAPALLDQVNTLEQKMQSINESAERAGVLTIQAFENGKYASWCDWFWILLIFVLVQYWIFSESCNVKLNFCFSTRG